MSENLELTENPEVQNQRKFLSYTMAFLCWGVAAYLLFGLIEVAIFLSPVLFDQMSDRVYNLLGIYTDNGFMFQSASLNINPLTTPIIISNIILLLLGGWYFWNQKLKKGLIYFIICLGLWCSQFLFSNVERQIDLSSIEIIDTIRISLLAEIF